MKNVQSFTTNRKIAFHIFLFKNFTYPPPPTPPVLLKVIVRAWRVAIHHFNMFNYKFSKRGEKLSLQTVKSFSSGFWEDHSY